MAKPVTSWSNNDVKPVVAWANNDVKPPATWTNNDVKSATSYTPATKNTDVWSRRAPTTQSYFYDDATIQYDSLLYQYDFLVNNNTDNQRQITTWADNT